MKLWVGGKQIWKNDSDEAWRFMYHNLPSKSVFNEQGVQTYLYLLSQELRFMYQNWSECHLLLFYIFEACYDLVQISKHAHLLGTWKYEKSPSKLCYRHRFFLTTFLALFRNSEAGNSATQCCTKSTSLQQQCTTPCSRAKQGWAKLSLLLLSILVQQENGGGVEPQLNFRNVKFSNKFSVKSQR